MSGIGTPVSPDYEDIAQMPGDAPMDGQKSGVRRELGEVAPERLALVKEIQKDVLASRSHWKKDFDRMKTGMDYVFGLQYVAQTDIDTDDRYVANIIQRHVQQRTAAIYAKNPTVVARRKEMMDFAMWDENPLTAQMAMQAVAMAGQAAQGAQQGNPQAMAAVDAVPPQAMQMVALAQELLDDIHQGMMLRAARAKISRTMELYFKNKVLSQQNPPFKASMKQLVRRTMGAGIGYAKLGLVRETDLSPDTYKGMATLQETMATINRMMADMIDNPEAMGDLNAEKAELHAALEALQQSKHIVTQEGLTFDFPGATSIIPDMHLQHLQGFVGCQRVSEEYMLTTDQVKEIWQVDVKGEGCSFASYDDNAGLQNGQSKISEGSGANPPVKKDSNCCVWITYDRTTGLVYTSCDGYKDFLEDPRAPAIALERFFPWYPLAFNLIEHHKQRFPLSDAFLLRHQQREYNRAREALRQHRIANRPATFVAAGVMDKKDQDNLQNRPANAVIPTNALAPGQKIDDVLSTLKHPPIDPAVYETDHVFQDVLRTVGSQEANLGGTSKSTATESSIAESSRMSSLQSNMDDMDDFLTEMMRDAGKVALMEIGADEVTRVVGPGASWPILTKQDVADEIFLEIAAGSSGRPNKAVEVQNFTQMLPFLLQIPGMNPEWLAKQALQRMDDRLDMTDAWLEGQPSIQTLNALAAKPLGQGPQGAGKPGGPGAEDPNAQGGQGGQNDAAGPDGAGGGLGAQPASMAGPAIAQAG